MQAVVLADRWTARTRVSTTTLVVAVAVVTFVAAQIRIPLPFTPVPITAQTFVVLVGGAALGWRAGAAAQALYIAVGIVGVPVFQDLNGGWTYATGSTGGYLVGFIVAAAVTGYLAERGQDRSVWSAVPAMLFGTVVIYACGVTWLMQVLNTDLSDALTKGMVPFVLGDLAKIALAGLVLPAAWRLTGRR
ncbi:MAG: biotin transporter BioY [Acidimicrobiia bacterium]|nr:biotin transporter BioY [Acidimicrobiia bacterium]